MCDVKVGYVIYMPMNDKELWRGVVEGIYNNVDPRLKYKVSFERQKVVMFFTEEMIQRCMEK